jgi:DNA-binding transcriptional regulator LsrR (DeoR family)
MDGAVLGVAGGRQTWCAVRSISPRRLRVQIAAVGVAANDPAVLHAHPNTLVTLLSVLYAPYGEAHLVGSPSFQKFWPDPATRVGADPRYFVLASCSPFDAASAFCSLIGPAHLDPVKRARPIGDFAGVFITTDGTLITPTTGTVSSQLSPDTLLALSRRKDACVMLVAGGLDKLPIIRATLASGLCNVLITDTSAADVLVRRGNP